MVNGGRDKGQSSLVCGQGKFGGQRGSGAVYEAVPRDGEVCEGAAGFMWGSGGV